MAQGPSCWSAEREHLLEVGFVAREHDREIREDAQVAEIEHTVVGRAVGAGESTAVEHERDRQILQCDFLEDLIVRPLEERAVDVDDRTEARFGLSGGEGDRVALADSGVKEAIGERVADFFELVALAHCGRDHGDARVGRHLVEDRLGGHVGERSPATGIHPHDLIRIAFELRRGMEQHGIGGGRRETVPFFGDHMQQDRAVGRLGHAQVFSQQADVVAVDRAEVAKAEVFEEHAAVDARFGGFFQLGQEPLDRVAQQRHLAEHADHLFLEAGVHAVHAEPVEIVGHAADARADRHLVVVEDHQQALAELAGVVHRLVDDARGERAVANHRDAPAVVVGAGQRIAARQSDCGRHTRAGVARDEQVVVALFGVGVAHQAALGADRVELREAAGEQLVRINLMPGVPDQPIVQEVERLMQGQAELDHAKVRCEMGAAGRDEIAKHFAHLGREPLELWQRELLKISRRLNRR